MDNATFSEQLSALKKQLRELTPTRSHLCQSMDTAGTGARIQPKPLREVDSKSLKLLPNTTHSAIHARRRLDDPYRLPPVRSVCHEQPAKLRGHQELASMARHHAESAQSSGVDEVIVPPTPHEPQSGADANTTQRSPHVDSTATTATWPHNQLTLPSGPLFWQLFTALRTDLRGLDSRVAAIEEHMMELDDRLDELEPPNVTPTSSEASSRVEAATSTPAAPQSMPRMLHDAVVQSSTADEWDEWCKPWPCDTAQSSSETDMRRDWLGDGRDEWSKAWTNKEEVQGSSKTDMRHASPADGWYHWTTPCKTNDKAQGSSETQTSDASPAVTSIDPQAREKLARSHLESPSAVTAMNSNDVVKLAELRQLNSDKLRDTRNLSYQKQVELDGDKQRSDVHGLPWLSHAWSSTTLPQTSPPESVAFRDREIVQLEELLRVAHERLQSTEESLSCRNAELDWQRGHRVTLEEELQSLQLVKDEYQDYRVLSDRRISESGAQLAQMCHDRDADALTIRTTATQVDELSQLVAAREAELFGAQQQLQHARAELHQVRAETEAEARRSMQSFCDELRRACVSKDAMIAEQQMTLRRKADVARAHMSDMSRVSQELRRMRGDLQDAHQDRDRFARLLYESNSESPRRPGQQAQDQDHNGGQRSDESQAGSERWIESDDDASTTRGIYPGRPHWSERYDGDFSADERARASRWDARNPSRMRPRLHHKRSTEEELARRRSESERLLNQLLNKTPPYTSHRPDWTLPHRPRVDKAFAPPPRRVETMPDLRSVSQAAAARFGGQPQVPQRRSTQNLAGQYVRPYVEVVEEEDEEREEDSSDV